MVAATVDQPGGFGHWQEALWAVPTITFFVSLLHLVTVEWLIERFAAVFHDRHYTIVSCFMFRQLLRLRGA